MRAGVLLLALAAGLFLAGCAGGQQGVEGGQTITGPLEVEILFPANDTNFASPNFTAVIVANGASPNATQDDFIGGIFVNTSFDNQGLRANATLTTSESYYISRVFEDTSASGRAEWSAPLDFLTSGSSADPTTLIALDARYGDSTAGRNWSAWFRVGLDGDLGDPRGPANESFLERPAFQYRVRFLDPMNASSPRIVLVEVWSLAPIVEVAARVLPGGSWLVLGPAGGRYNFSVNLSPGPATVEARATDARGWTRTASAAVSYDTERPAVERALANGTSVPPDTAAEIRFSEPIDPASASVNVRVDAPFPVDVVWSADNRSLFVSAQQSGARGPVKITLGAGLRDRVGNTLGTDTTYTYEMGVAPATGGDNTGFLVALFVVVGAVGAAALVISSRARKNNLLRAREVRGELGEEGGARPPE